MKKANHSLKAASVLSFFLSVVILFSVSSCSQKMTFGISPVVPAAIGTVKIQTDKNNNYRVDVTLKNLAASNRLTPPRATYIVWVETQSNGVKNIGQINTSGKNLKGSLRTNFPFKPVNVFITAEDLQNVATPGSTIILTTKKP